MEVVAIQMYVLGIGSGDLQKEVGARQGFHISDGSVFNPVQNNCGNLAFRKGRTSGKAIQLQPVNIFEREGAFPLVERGLLPVHFDIPEPEIPGIAKTHGVHRGVVRRRRIAGDEELDIFQRDSIQPAIRMAVESGSSLAMHDNVVNDDVVNRTRAFVELHGLAIPFAFPLEFEVECVAVSSPKPVKAVQVHGEIRHDNVADRAPSRDL